MPVPAADGDNDVEVLKTVNCRIGLLVPSDACILCEPTVADAGTTNEAVKPPAALEVTVVGVVASSVPSNLIVIVALGLKLVPVTVTEEPTLADVGLRVIAAFVTANGWDAVSPAGLAAVTVCCPIVDPAGTVNVALNCLFAAVVIVAGFVVTVLPSNLIVMALFGA